MKTFVDEALRLSIALGEHPFDDAEDGGERLDVGVFEKHDEASWPPRRNSPSFSSACIAAFELSHSCEEGRAIRGFHDAHALVAGHQPSVHVRSEHGLHGARVQRADVIAGVE